MATVKQETANVYHIILLRESKIMVPVAGALSTKPPREKGTNRQITESSIILAMSYASVVLTIHFQISSKNELPNKNITKGSKK